MFELTKPQKEIQKAAKDFAKGEFDKELAYELEKEGNYPTEIWQKAAELGFIGIHFPESCSGGEMGVFENCLIIEELCRKDPSLGSAIIEASNASECILRFGSDVLKSNTLTPIAEGSFRSAGALGETERGENYHNIKTTADNKDETWVINGKKTNVINVGDSGCYIVLCNTSSSGNGDDLRLNMILVDSNVQGLEFKSYGKRLGCNMLEIGDLYFSEVSVPYSNLIGKEGKGNTQLQTYLDERRIILAAQALGNALASFDRMLEYVKGREQFGRKIAEFQVSQHKIADMATKIELSRLAVQKAAWLFDHKKKDSSLCSMAKMTASRTAMEIGAQSIQLFGGYGYMTEYEVERFYREAKIIELREGSMDVQKDIIAKSAIGKIK